MGDIYLYEAHFHRYRPQANPQRWKENEELGAGILYDLGVHLLDQALQLFGMPDAIDGEVITQRPNAIASDYFHLTLKYGPKRVILKSSSLVCHPGPRYQIHGSQASFLKSGMDPQEQDLMAGKNPLDKKWGQGREEGDGILSFDQYSTQIPTLPGNYAMFYTSLADALHGNALPPVLPEEVYQAIQLIEMCSLKSRHFNVTI